LIGVWVAILPYLGFPISWKNSLFTLTGLGIAYFAFVLYKEFNHSANKPKDQMPDNFSENKNFKIQMNEMRAEDSNPENNV
jgi:hypothetical protein